MRLPAFAHDILLLFAGPIVWAVHFLGIYALTGIACARPGVAAGWLGLAWEGWAIVLAGITAAAVLALTLLLRSRSGDAQNRGFVQWTSRALAALAVLAIAWETLSVFLVPACPHVGG
jgi:hypothetical protein